MRRARHTGGGELNVAGATVIDGTGAPPVGPVDMVVRDGRIQSVGEIAGSSNPPTIDGTGRYLIPGLWETEAHLTRYGNGILAQLTLDWREEGDVDRVAANLYSYLLHGITTVVDLGGPADVLAALRDREERGEVLGARLLIVGRQITARRGSPIINGKSLPAVTLEVRDPDDARAALRREIGDYAIDAVKVNYTAGGPPFASTPIISRATLEAVVQEAHAHDLTVHVHIDDAGAALDALDAGVDNIEHMFAPNPATLREDAERVIESCAQRGAFWPFTLALWEGSTRAGERAFLEDLHLERLIPRSSLYELESSAESMWHQAPPAFREVLRQRFEAGMRFVAPALAAGVKMTIATDAGNPMTFHGPSTVREMELMADAGVPAADILVSATSAAAQKLRLADDLGSLEPGKIADMLLLDANPLEDIANVRKIAAVIQRGHAYRPDELFVAALEREGRRVDTTSSAGS